ncbi:crossover junction endodeoxyribonuclease RuvC [Alcaligenaceae bacterium SJ-26]|nr:crossover junction endodeoxyribonuclease RuvC [Alcaligenaceae bacterium SJ-26]
MRILGVDPGLRRTGFGVIELDRGQVRYIASGAIVVPADQPMSERLRTILANLREVVRQYEPDISALEKVFVNTNPASTLLLGQARGTAMCALADAGLAVHEYTALQIKKSVVGTGRATKHQVQTMVQHLLRLNGLPPPDPADALACAICHAHTGQLSERVLAIDAQTGAAVNLPRHRKTLRRGRVIGHG